MISSDAIFCWADCMLNGNYSKTEISGKGGLIWKEIYRGEQG